MTTHFDDVHRDTVDVYERNASEWDKHRSRSFPEKPWIEKFLQTIPLGETVLDIGCGAGDPIARYIIELGYLVTGIDASPSMIEICKSKFPEQTWILGDMRELDLDQEFRGILAWDSFFHLKQDEQRAALREFLRILASNGTLLLTIGHEEGEVLGAVQGEQVFHSSLAPREYEEILVGAGMQHIQFQLQDQSCGRRSILFARK